MAEFASKGVAGAGLGLGIAGTALSLMNGGLGNLAGVGGPQGHAPMCSESTPVNRFELGQSEKIADLEMQIAIGKSNEFTLGEMSKVKEYLETKIDNNYREQNGINMRQVEYNATNTGAINVVATQVQALQAVTQLIVPQNRVCNTCCPTQQSGTTF